MKYTIKSVMPTGKTSQMYGTEYYIQFNEVDKAFPLWFKQDPAVGSELEGEINGSKFKKVKKEWKEDQSSQSQSNPTTSSPTGTKPAYKDNSDGMRQGMCFNNAANYVNSLDFGKPLTDSEWARTVFAYAQALYRMGDLNVAPEGSQVATEPVVEQPTPLENVQAVFGNVQPVPVL